MSVARSIKVRVVTPYSNCVELIEMLVQDFWSFNKDGSINTLRIDDTEDFDFVDFEDYQEVKPILLERERRGLNTPINLWDQEYEESILFSFNRIENTYWDKGYITQYELNFLPGFGRRIVGADRYTDYGFYLNQLIPKLLQIGCYVCEITCQDFDS
jgi:hypothetical protein